jgi:uncharacterized protein
LRRAIGNPLRSSLPCPLFSFRFVDFCAASFIGLRTYGSRRAMVYMNGRIQGTSFRAKGSGLSFRSWQCAFEVAWLFCARPALHIFVVTLRCEHSCPYCQVSRQSTDRSRFDMAEDTAERALAIALQSPSPRIKIEFQGGEPLLNFKLIEKIVLAAEHGRSSTGKAIDFVIASNLALLTDEILAFCKSHEILISTSLDGPAELHNKNRPRPGGNSHELAVKGIKRAQDTLGRDRVSALMTTTEASLDRVEQIVDEYLSLGLDGIFLRPLSPYGFAIKTKQFNRYSGKRWLDFYRRGLRYILDINQHGTFFAGILCVPSA